MDETINMNSSFVSHRSNTSINKKYNLKDNFNFDQNSMTKFQEFLNSYNSSKNVLLFSDSKNNYWEIVRRPDITSNTLLNKSENIVSVVSGMYLQNSELLKSGNKSKNYDNDEYLNQSKFYNIEIKDRSLNQSELDISKFTDLNMSFCIRDNMD